MGRGCRPGRVGRQPRLQHAGRHVLDLEAQFWDVRAGQRGGQLGPDQHVALSYVCGAVGWGHARLTTSAPRIPRRGCGGASPPEPSWQRPPQCMPASAANPRTAPGRRASAGRARDVGGWPRQSLTRSTGARAGRWGDDGKPCRADQGASEAGREGRRREVDHEVASSSGRRDHPGLVPACQRSATQLRDDEGRPASPPWRCPATHGLSRTTLSR